MIGVGLSGRFDLTRIDATTGEVREQRSFPNVILDTALDKFFMRDNPWGNNPCPALGVGRSEPSPSDTGLQSMAYEGNYIYQKSGYPNKIAPQAPNWVSSLRYGWRIEANQAVGNFTEIGVKGWTPGSAFWCRALIVDAEGNPSAITVLPNEYLDIVYTLNFHPDLQDRQFTFQMNGLTYNVTSRMAYIAASGLSSLQGSTGRLYSMSGTGNGGMWATQQLGEITSGPSGQRVNSVLENSVQPQPYETNSYTGKTLLSWGLDRANVEGGIGSLIIDEGNPRVPTQMSFTPKIPKNATNELSLMFAVRVYRVD